MKLVESKNIEEIIEACARPSISNEQIKPIIEEVFKEIENKGDEAVLKYTHFFDKVDLNQLEMERYVVEELAAQTSVELQEAIKVAAKNIERFHASQQINSTKIETAPGVFCWQESRGIERVGIYIPGGTAPLFSTVLMLAIPAKIAGCKEIILCTPPDKNGNINPAIAFAASITGVNRVFRVGGAQAIAAMTYGTESVPKVYKIFGPGNQFVTAAKVKAQEYGIAIDMPAGPSELMVVADDSCVPAFVAADLLSQAEHGTDSQVICVLNTAELYEPILTEVKAQLADLPRKDIAEKALENSRFIIAEDRLSTIEIINEYAPEHLIICTEYNNELIMNIENAGSVFVGNYTPESAGDYASGTNHTLPTAGFAKAYSGVNLDAFTKKITFQEISKNGIQELGPTIEKMAEAELLQAHKNAVTLRLK